MNPPSATQNPEEAPVNLRSDSVTKYSNASPDSPPSYQSVVHPDDDACDESIESNDNADSSEIINVEAGVEVNGTGNIINTDNTLLGGKVATALAAIVSRRYSLNRSTSESRNAKPSTPSINICLNCSIKVTGQRNIVGAIRAQLPQTPRNMKRKADNTNTESLQEPVAKKMAI